MYLSKESNLHVLGIPKHSLNSPCPGHPEKHNPSNTTKKVGCSHWDGPQSSMSVSVMARKAKGESIFEVVTLLESSKQKTVHQLLPVPGLDFQVVVPLPHPLGLVQGTTPEGPAQRCTSETSHLQYLSPVTQVGFS